MKLAEQPSEGAILAGNQLRQMIETALPIARQRAELVGQMRNALEKDDQRAALAIARRLCGLRTEEALR